MSEEKLIKTDDAIENYDEIKKEVEEIEDHNPMELVEDNATGDNHQVTLSVDPLKPQEDVEDDPLTAAEKKVEEEFQEVMADLEEEALPQLEATIDAENLGEEDPGDFNPLKEEGNSELVEKVLEISEPVKAEFVQTEIVNAEKVLDVEVQEHDKSKEELVEKDDDKTEDVTEKVDNLTAMTVNGPEEDIKPIKTGDIESGRAPEDEDSDQAEVRTAEIAIEDANSELSAEIEKLHDEIGVGDSDQVQLGEVELKGEFKENGEPEEASEIVNENSQVGSFTVKSLQAITPEGVAEKEVDVEVLSIDENPLDECETGEVIHTGTVDTADLPADLKAEVKEIIGTEDEDALAYEIKEADAPEARDEVTSEKAVADEVEVAEHFDDVTEKEIVNEDTKEATGTDEVIEGSFAEVVLATAADANPDIDFKKIDEFAASLESAENPDAVEEDYRYVIDETAEIVKEEGGPMLGDPLTEHVEQLDAFIKGEDAEIVDGTVVED